MLFTPPAFAEPLPEPSGRVILTVTGDIGVRNTPAAAEFDRAMLRSIGQRDISTTTIWTSGKVTFTGVPLRSLLDRLGVSSGKLEARAINEYSVTIPVSDAVPDGPIIAYSRDGEEISIREKGPLWIIYPYDQNPDYQSEVIYARSIWQLDRIDVID
ncbi:molybdopterin-dependent oxidoreductase [Roseovarius salis]|uniref:molybdopterin-dependent oxidoreductase n=1 Tax=Roseovarius salis TaxID=3376063 RepID=UPI0037C9B2A5